MVRRTGETPVRYLEQSTLRAVSNRITMFQHRESRAISNSTVRYRLLRWLILLELCLCACRTGGPLTVAPATYRVAASGEEHLLLPPPIPVNYSESDVIRLRLKVPARRNRSCVLDGLVFRLAPAADKEGGLVLTLPSLKSWQEKLLAAQSPSRSDAFLNETGAFFDAVRALDSKGCLPAGTALPIRDLILASLPIRLDQGLFASYGYWAGKGAMDLRPGLRLEVERAYYRDTDVNAAAKSLANYVGTSTATYDILEKQGRSIRFHLTGVEYKPQELAKRHDRGIPDFTLARLAGAAPFYRLLLASDFVPERIKRSALLIGSTSLDRVNTVTKQFQARHGLGCADLTQGPDTLCVEFDGEVTVSPQVQVMVNGQTRFVSWGSNLKAVMGEQSAEQIAAAMKTLRVERLFDSRFSEIQFPRDDGGILELTLVGGDRVSW